MRIRDVAITDEGRAAFETVWPTMYEFLMQMFEGIDEDEQRSFVATLQKIMRNVRKNEF
jgi:DNA-binding MarR family transcriptional regulator